MAERSDLYSRGVSTASEHDPNFAPVAALLSNPTNLHITFVNDGGVVATFGSDNIEHLRGWWLIQCAKLNNPGRPKFWLMMNVREFTQLRDTQTGLPIKRLSACVFRHGEPVEPLTADATRWAFGTDAKTGVPLPPRPDIVFVDFAA
jgi:hypothetical protein